MGQLLLNSLADERVVLRVYRGQMVVHDGGEDQGKWFVHCHKKKPFFPIVFGSIVAVA
jgi:hypothetical protein